jgi:hypothetical protein
MQISDFTLLAKKIAVGIVITVVPLGILVGPLWLTQHNVKKSVAPTVSRAAEVSHAN